ncbi:MAG: hypothetical protein EOO77_30445, partial [Oxalobacteraceae bacterium]
MITLIQTNSDNRLDIAMGNLGDAPAEGYIERLGDQWFPFGFDNELRATKGHTNPVDAGCLVIENFRSRAALLMDDQIAALEAELEGDIPAFTVVPRQRRLAS